MVRRQLFGGSPVLMLAYGAGTLAGWLPEWQVSTHKVQGIIARRQLVNRWQGIIEANISSKENFKF